MVQGTLRLRHVALALAVGVAGTTLVRAVMNRNPPGNFVVPLSAASTSRPLETTSSQAASQGESNRDAHRADMERAGTRGVALDNFDAAIQTAPEEDLDLIAAARLPDLVRRDPRTVARFIELQPSSKQREVLVRHFSRLWGESNAEGAYAWAQSLPNAQERDLASRAVCLSLSQTNPLAAVHRCAGIGADAAGEAEFQGVFQAWVQSDPVAASEWLAAQPPGARVDKLRERQVHVLAKSDPLKALRMAQEGFTTPSNRDEAVLAALHQWGLQDPRAAREWVGIYVHDELRARALAEIDGVERYAANR